jgi:glycosyltransferase involved in cell wall biosynthesis
MIHERFPQFYNSSLDDVARRQKRRCIQNADAVICISEATLQDMKRFYGDLEGKVLSVTPLACSDIFRVLEPDAGGLLDLAGEPFLLYVGSRWGYKNFSSLLEIYRSWDGRESVSLVAVGPPWEKDENQVIKRLGLSERIKLFTDVDDETLCQLYNRAMAFVYPSLCEGFGIPLLEAMACGCPIIASRIPSTLEVAADCPVYFGPDRPDTFLAALDTVKAELRHTARIQKGLDRVKHFSWDETSQRTLAIYRSL